MEIPNLATPSTTPLRSSRPLSPLPVILILVLAVTSGFWLSRLSPSTPNSSSGQSSSDTQSLSADNISSTQDIKINTIYGNSSANFKDSATGVIKKGGINGEGTHTLERPGGVTQNAALTSSTLDLDLFVDRQVEVRGETNSSNKSGWLLDVGTVKVLQ